MFPETCKLSRLPQDPYRRLHRLPPWLYLCQPCQVSVPLLGLRFIHSMGKTVSSKNKVKFLQVAATTVALANPVQTHAVHHFSPETALRLPFWGLALPWLARAGAPLPSPPPPLPLLPALQAAYCSQQPPLSLPPSSSRLALRSQPWAPPTSPS